VVVPAVHEADRIGPSIEAIRRALAPIEGDGIELVVVDDGSDDGTAEAAEAAGADLVLRHEHNRGKGAAVRTGMAATSGRAVAFTDADLAYPPEQLLALLEQVEAGADVVLGNRRDPASTTVVAASALRDLGGRVINLLTRSVLAGRWNDTQGGLKAFGGDVGRALLAATEVEGFAFDVEVLAVAERWQLDIVEVPVVVSHSEASTVHVVADAARLVGDLVGIRRRLRAGRYDRGGTVPAAPPTSASVAERDRGAASATE
jgi:glycosyltransferase involved in cell wall biosynthesis